MKPIRNYSDGQWLLLLWFFVAMFLVVGIFISTLVLVIAVLGALGAGYTTYLYLRANDFSLPFLPAARSRGVEPNDQFADDEDEYDDEEYEYEDGPDAPVVDSFERPTGHSDTRTSPDLSEGDTR